MSFRQMIEASLANLGSETAGLPAPPAEIRSMLNSMKEEELEGLFKGFMETKAAGGLPSAETKKSSKAKDNKAPGDDAVWEAAFQHCCREAVVNEFKDLPKEAKKKLLKAFQSSAEDKHLDILMREDTEEAMHLGSIQEAFFHGPKADDTDPLVKALSVNSSVPVKRSAAAKVASMMDHWGEPMPKPITLMLYERGLQHQRQQIGKHESNEGFLSLRTNNTVQKPESGAKSREWAALKQIGVDDLRLFQVSKGCVLTGTLCVDPHATVGVTTLLEDSRGSVVQLGIYNMLPGGPTGAKAHHLAQQVFPKGLKVSIAEPFYKIFMDGMRGVRIDEPPDLKVHNPHERSGLSLQEARQQGNASVKEKAFLSASALYWQGLRSQEVEKEVAQLLSNRAQACLKLGQWASALADSAAALVLTPKSSKAWQRYAAALDGMGQASLAAQARALAGREAGEKAPAGEVRAVLMAGLACAVLAAEDEGAAPREAGNEAYKSGNFEKAAKLYTAALAQNPVAADVAAVLGNIALCALRTNMLHDAVAAAAAALRVLPGHLKAKYRLAKGLVALGELDLAEQVLSEDRGDRDCGALLGRAAKIRQAMAEKSWNPGLLQELCDADEQSAPDWVDETAVKLGYVGTKGRGLIAARSIEMGEVLLFQRGRVSKSVGGLKDDRGFVMTVNSSTRCTDDGSQTELKALTTNLLCYDQLLAFVLADLHDGSRESGKLPLPDWDDLLHRLGSRALPLLPSHPDYFHPAEKARVEQSSARVQRVLSTNSHGGKASDIKVLQGMGVDESCLHDNLTEAKSTSLYPAISMLNHAGHENCVHLPILRQGEMAVLLVLAARRIVPGEELTVEYHSDPETLERKWGIKE